MLREMIFEDSSLVSEEDDDHYFEIAVGMIFNEGFSAAEKRITIRLYTPQPRESVGHANIVRDK